jgi:hypothetical protein
MYRFAGPAVQSFPATPTGLSTTRTLAGGVPSMLSTVTNISALLQLKSPADTIGGTNAATLTLV